MSKHAPELPPTKDVLHRVALRHGKPPEAIQQERYKYLFERAATSDLCLNPAEAADVMNLEFSDERRSHVEACYNCQTMLEIVKPPKELVRGLSKAAVRMHQQGVVGGLFPHLVVFGPLVGALGYFLLREPSGNSQVVYSSVFADSLLKGFFFPALVLSLMVMTVFTFKFPKANAAISPVIASALLVLFMFSQGALPESEVESMRETQFAVLSAVTQATSGDKQGAVLGIKMGDRNSGIGDTAGVVKLSNPEDVRELTSVIVATSAPPDESQVTEVRQRLVRIPIVGQLEKKERSTWLDSFKTAFVNADVRNSGGDNARYVFLDRLTNKVYSPYSTGEGNKPIGLIVEGKVLLKNGRAITVKLRNGSKIGVAKGAFAFGLEPNQTVKALISTDSMMVTALVSE